MQFNFDLHCKVNIIGFVDVKIWFCNLEVDCCTQNEFCPAETK